jgi:hypothetical protein
MITLISGDRDAISSVFNTRPPPAAACELIPLSARSSGVASYVFGLGSVEASALSDRYPQPLAVPIPRIA